jgi:hypothetical protein
MLLGGKGNGYSDFPGKEENEPSLHVPPNATENMSVV